jgi:glycosyltransferase involved in cell wall biosynthesis
MADLGVGAGKKVALFANTDWYLYNFRLSLARRLRDVGYDVVLISPPGDYCQRLVVEGFRWLPVAMDRRSLNPLAEIGVVARLIDILQRERPDLLHSFTIKSVVYGSLAARAVGKIARVNAVAGLGHVFTSDNVRNRLLRPIVRGLLRLALGGENGRLVVQNGDDRRQFVDLGLAAERQVRLIRGSGVDTDRFQPVVRAQLGRPPTVLLASRLLWAKGIGHYVEAARRLRADGLTINVLLAGRPDPGNPDAIPLATVQAWHAEGVVTWLDHVDDMAGLLNEIDIFVLPSGYGEGVPKSLLEAAACEKALITTDTPGCREVVIDGSTGLLIPVGDPDALASAIRQLVEDKALATRLGRAARERARSEFDATVVSHATLSVYGELI